ncbi:MAG TPA: phospholipase D-like domain-containing protein [Vicinamibacterales bacterium]
MQIVVVRRRWKSFCLVLSAAFALVALSANVSSAREELCDPSFQDCRAPLLALMNAETTEIDVGLWFMTDARYSNLLVSKAHAGVKIRILMDPREFAQDPVDQTNMNQLQSAGIPMRKRIASGIEHWKAMIFASQNTVYFGSANFDPLAFVPNQPYQNYADETVYFTDDASVVNSFMTKFDDAWTDTVSYATYANVTDPLTRSYPTSTIDPELNFPPGQDFANRSVGRYNAETSKIDVDMFRITDQRHTNAIIAAAGRGVPIRLMVDPDEYRLPTRLWDAWNVDRLYAAGIATRVTVHQGLNHSKLVLLYGQGMTIFGSSNWTTPSANSQHEHNYFTKNASIFNWFVTYFERRWNNSAGFAETGPFTPLPPDKPVYQTPANSTVGMATSGVKLVWDGGPWAHVYDIYFGTSPTPPLFAPNQNLGPDDPTKSPAQYQSFALPTLTAGTTYYWQIVSKTMANQTKAGPIFSFTTAGTPPPPPPGATTVVMWTANIPAASVHGNWTAISDTTAAGGTALENPDGGQAKIAPALASPSNYFEQTFNAVSGADYHLWVRMRAQNNSLSNDSVHVQFNDSVDSVGTAVMRIGSTSSAEVVLQNGPNGVADHGWGWGDNGWGSPGVNIRFAADGAHTVRIQQREDGAIVDQIVLSPDTYVTTPPGPRQNDATILPNTDGSGPPPPPPPPPSNTIVLWLSQSSTLHGNWQMLSDTTAAGNSAVWNPDAGAAKIAPALASPTNYIETTFAANSATAYHVWLRMRAQGDSLSNDSVHIQYSDSVNSSGTATAQIGTTSSTEYVLQNGPNGPADQSWGWTDNGWGALGANIFFATTGTHTLRIQQREDGAIVDQIVISPDTYLSASPGARQNDATILPSTGGSAPPPPPPPSSNTVVLWFSDTPSASINGKWQPLGDASAANGTALWNPDAGAAKVAPALASPLNYIERTFTADAGTAYHVWLRMRAQGDSLSNDSVHVQFSDSVDSGGAAFAHIGSTSSTEYVLQNGSSGPPDKGWGWTENGWGSLGPNIFFAAGGSHTLRVQQREDGAIIDQIVISPDTYLTTSPGARQNDSTVLPKSQT